MADEILKRFLVELAYKIDEQGWSRFNQTINVTNVTINNFSQTLNVLSQRMTALVTGGSAAGGGGGGGGAGGGLWGLLGAGSVGQAGSILGSMAGRGALGALTLGIGALGGMLKFAATQGLETIRMFSGLYWAAQRTQVGVGSLLTARAMENILGVPFGGAMQNMGYQLQRYPPLIQSLAKRFGVDVKYDKQGNISNWAEIFTGMGRKWSGEGFGIGEQEAQMYGIGTDVYATIRRDWKTFETDAKKVEALRKRMGLDPEKLGEEAADLNTKLEILAETIREKLAKYVQEFIDELEKNPEKLDEIFNSILHFVTDTLPKFGEAIKAVSDAILNMKRIWDQNTPGTPEYEKRPRESLLPRWLEDWLTGGKSARHDEPSPEDQKRTDEQSIDATKKNTAITEKLTEQMTKIASVGDLMGLKGDEGGPQELPESGGATYRRRHMTEPSTGSRGRGGGGDSRGGGPMTPEDWKAAGERHGALTALIKQKAIEAAGGDNAEAQRIFEVMQGIRAGESAHGAKYDWNPRDPAGGAFGPWQMVGGGRMGTQFQRATGRDYRDPRTIPDQAAYVARWIHEHPYANYHRTWFGYKGRMKGDPRWGESGYHPSGDVGGDGGVTHYKNPPIGDLHKLFGAGAIGGHHVTPDQRDQSISAPVTINVTGFDDPREAGNQIASAIDNTHKKMVRDFRTKFA
jgi:hypothetical protein